MPLRFFFLVAYLLISATIAAQDWYAVIDPLDADDAAGRLAQICHQKADGSALAQYSYQRDAKGRLTRATEETGGQITNKSWEYDAELLLHQEHEYKRNLQPFLLPFENPQVLADEYRECLLQPC